MHHPEQSNPYTPETPPSPDGAATPSLNRSASYHKHPTSRQHEWDPARYPPPPPPQPQPEIPGTSPQPTRPTPPTASSVQSKHCTHCSELARDAAAQRSPERHPRRECSHPRPR